MRKKIVRFGLVGVFNTLFNILLFNFLLFGLKFSLGWANLVSIIISISISFVLNTKFVFNSQSNSQRNKSHTYIAFFASSLFSQIIVQQLIVTAFANHITGPGQLVHSIALHLPLLSTFSRRFYIVNTAKILAVAASLAINFLLYDKVVFKHRAAEPAD